MATGCLSAKESGALGLLTALSIGLLSRAFNHGGEPIIASLALSGCAFTATYALIVQASPSLLKVFSGKDMAKKNPQPIPECAGLICAVVYILVIIVFIPFAFYKDIVAATSGGGNRDVVYEVEHVNQGRFLHKFPHSKVGALVLEMQSSMGLNAN